MCVNLPLSFDHGWWECGDKGAERRREGQEADVGGRGEGAGVCEKEEAVALISLRVRDHSVSLSCAKNKY